MSGLDEAVISAWYRERQPKMLPWDETNRDVDSALHPTPEPVNSVVHTEELTINGKDIRQTDVADDNCILLQKTVDEIHTKMALGEIPIVNERFRIPKANKTDDKCNDAQSGTVIVDIGLESEIPKRNPEYDLFYRYPAYYCPKNSKELPDSVSYMQMYNCTKAKSLIDHIEGSDKLGFPINSSIEVKDKIGKCNVSSFGTRYDTDTFEKSLVTFPKTDITFGQRKTGQAVIPSHFEKKAESETGNVSSLLKSDLLNPKTGLTCRTKESHDMLEEVKGCASTRRKQDGNIGKGLETVIRRPKMITDGKEALKVSRKSDQQTTETQRPCKIDKQAVSNYDKKEMKAPLLTGQADHHGTEVDELLTFTDELKSDDAVAITTNKKSSKVEGTDASTKIDAHVFDTQKAIHEILHSSDDEVAFTSKKKMRNEEGMNTGTKVDVFDTQKVIREITNSSDDEVAFTSNKRINQIESTDARVENDVVDTQKIIREILHSSEDEVNHTRVTRKDRNTGYKDKEERKRKKRVDTYSRNRISNKNEMHELFSTITDRPKIIKGKAADTNEDSHETIKSTSAIMDNKQSKPNDKRRTKCKYSKERRNAGDEIVDNCLLGETIEDVNRKGEVTFDKKVKQQKQKKGHSQILVVDPEEVLRKNRRKAFEEDTCIQNAFSQMVAKQNALYCEKNTRSEDDIFDISPAKDRGGLLDSDTDEMEPVDKFETKHTNRNEDTKIIDRGKRDNGYSESASNKRESRKQMRKKPKLDRTRSDGHSQTIIEKHNSKKKKRQVNNKSGTAIDCVKVGKYNENEVSKEKGTVSVRKRVRNTQKKDYPYLSKPSTRLHSTEAVYDVPCEKGKATINKVKKKVSKHGMISRKPTPSEENNKIHSAPLRQDINAYSRFMDISKVQKTSQLFQSHDSVLPESEVYRSIVINSEAKADRESRTVRVDNGNSVDSLQTSNLNETGNMDNGEIEEDRPKQLGKLERFFRWCLCCFKPKTEE